jgi:hypothetical protein
LWSRKTSFLSLDHARFGFGYALVFFRLVAGVVVDTAIVLVGAIPVADVPVPEVLAVVVGSSDRSTAAGLVADHVVGTAERLAVAVPQP